MVMKSKSGTSTSGKPVDYSKQLEAIKKQGSNKSCFDCGEKGTTYVVINFGTFVCSRCSGILRELNFKVKGTGVSIFSEKDIELINRNGNDKAKEIWLAKFNINRDRLPDPRKYEDVKQHIIDKYKNKKYYSTEEKSSKNESDSEEDSDDDKHNDTKYKKKEEKVAKIKKPKIHTKEKEQHEAHPAKILPLINFNNKDTKSSMSNNAVEQNEFQFPTEEKNQQSDANDWGSIWGNTSNNKGSQFVQNNEQVQSNQGNVNQHNNNPFDIPFNMPNSNQNNDVKQQQQKQIPIQNNTNSFMSNDFINPVNQHQQQQQQQQQQTGKINPSPNLQGFNQGNTNQKDFASLEKALFEQNTQTQFPQQMPIQPNPIGVNPSMNSNNIQNMFNNPQMMMQMMMQNPQMMNMMMSMMNGQNPMNMPNTNMPNTNMPNMNMPNMQNMAQNSQMNKTPLDYNKIFQDTPPMNENQSEIPKQEEKEDAFKNIYTFSQKALKKVDVNQTKPPNIPIQPQVNNFNQPPLINNNHSNSIGFNGNNSQIPIPTNTNPSNNPFDFPESTTTTQSMSIQPPIEQPKAFPAFQEQPQPLIAQTQSQPKNINQMGDYNPFNFL